MTEEYLWTPRWYLLDWHAIQEQLWNTAARFVVVPAGRRSGKTELCKRIVVRESMDGTEFDPSRFLCAAPTRPQAKDIFWDDLIKMVPRKMMIGKPNETEGRIRLRNFAGGISEIYVHGLDTPERIEGRPWDLVVVDEIANCKPKAWSAHLRPALDTKGRPGRAFLIGVPEGMGGIYHGLWKYALSGVDPEWVGFTWHSADILPPEVIEAAQRELDEITFDQEYRGSFVNFTGRAYYGFQTETHTAALEYLPDAPLHIGLDFNVDPGTATIMQEQLLPGGELGTAVIGEVWIPRASNTEMVCAKLVQDWGHHKGDVYLYGDATGGARRSSQTSGTDWDIVAESMRATFRNRVHFRVPAANPSERARVNSVNSRLCSRSGAIRLMVDPVKAPHTVEDFEGVRVVEGSTGELDKKTNPALTHLSDGIGYRVHTDWPVARKITGHIHSDDIAAAIGKPVEAHAPQ